MPVDGTSIMQCFTRDNIAIPLNKIDSFKCLKKTEKTEAVVVVHHGYYGHNFYFDTDEEAQCIFEELLSLVRQWA